MMKVRIATLMPVVAVAALVLSACAPVATPAPAAPEPAEGTAPPQPGETAVPSPVACPLNRDPDTLIVHTSEGIPTIDPPASPFASAAMVQRGVYETLVRYSNEKHELEPFLAESWEVNEDNSVWTFHLHQGVKFHDGEPFDAQAVKDNYVRMVGIDLGLSAVLGRFLTDPENQIVVIDEHTVEFRFDQPQPVFGEALGVIYGAFIVSPKAFREHEVDGDWGHQWLETHGVGTGPYTLEEFKPEEQVVMVRFDEYWRGWEGNHFEKIIIKVVEDISANRELLEKGDVDMVLQCTPEDTEALQENPCLVVHNDFGVKYSIVFMGCYGPLASPEARQAMSYAFDYDAYVDLMRGQVRRLYGPMTSSQFGYDPDIFRYETDLEKAAELLEEAGIEPGTELVWITSGHWAPNAELIMQSQLEKLGLTLRIEKVDSNAVLSACFGDSPAEGRFNFASMMWWPDYDDPWNALQALYHSENWGFRGANGSYYANERADELFDAMRNVTTKDEMLPLAFELQNVLTEQDPPCLYISEDPDQTIHRTDIRGYDTFIPMYCQTYPFYEMYRE